jgi:putative methionine-R-sulfoxide reductase with GAF domain
MKFFRDTSLKRLGAYLIALMLLVFIAQYFLLQYHINQLDTSERRIDFTRYTQLEYQQLCYSFQKFSHGDATTAGDIAARIKQQDHLLDVLSKGGRIDGTDLFLDPLSRLPRITFVQLEEQWKEYKDVTFHLLEQTSGEPIGANKSLILQEGLQLNINTWFNRLIVDFEEGLGKQRNAVLASQVAFIAVDLLFIVGIYFLFVRHVLKPLHILESNTANHRHTEGLAANEIGQVANTVSETIENLRDATDFVQAIGEGNLTLDYKQALDNNYARGNNRLADSLIDMQERLKQLNEEEKKRQWANEGLTRFVDILRSSNDNIHTLGDKIISSLVHYTHSNQGGLYILNDDDERNKYLELISLFAFDIKKHSEQRIKLGEGILGQTFLERETTYITNIPQEYVRITSGLGDSTPKAILIVPLKVDQAVYGLVELASFDAYEPHEIAFVEKLGETIASTLGNVKAAQKNRILIEQFQEQTEQMRAQEEEMRQNMEELQATQEEISRKERSYITRIQSLENEIQSLQSQLSSSGGHDELVHTLKEKEQSYLSRIQELESRLAQKPEKGDDWAIAEEVERALKINLEALKITREALRS